MYQYPGGLVAFAIVLLSILTAWAMNYTNPKIRVFGTILAAIGCFAVAVWFLSFVATSGILENPKPNQTPMDSAKPMTLWIQALVSLASGVFLLFIARNQSKESYTLNLSVKMKMLGMEKFLVFYIGQLQFYLYHLFQWVFLHQSFLKEHLLDFLIMSFISQLGLQYLFWLL